MNKPLAAMLCAGLAATLAGSLVAAQTKTATPAKPAPTAAPTTPAAPAAAPAKEACPCCSKSDGKGGGCPMMAEKGEAGCSMEQAATLADVKVENTKTGANIVFVAKDAANLQKVQEFAKELAAHINSPHAGMGMHASGMHEHH
jgi:hypothetical protein